MPVECEYIEYKHLKMRACQHYLAPEPVIYFSPFVHPTICTFIQGLYMKLHFSIFVKNVKFLYINKSLHSLLLNRIHSCTVCPWALTNVLNIFTSGCNSVKTTHRSVRHITCMCVCASFYKWVRHWRQTWGPTHRKKFYSVRGEKLHREPLINRSNNYEW